MTTNSDGDDDGDVLNSGWKGRTRVSIESMEERQPIYKGVRGALAGMLAEHESPPITQV